MLFEARSLKLYSSHKIHKIIFHAKLWRSLISKSIESIFSALGISILFQEINYKSVDTNFLIFNLTNFILCKRIRKIICCCLIFLRKPKNFSSMYFLQISRERTRSKIWYVRYEFLVAPAVFSRFLRVAATCRIFRHRPRWQGRQICRERFRRGTSSFQAGVRRPRCTYIF